MAQIVAPPKVGIPDPCPPPLRGPGPGPSFGPTLPETFMLDPVLARIDADMPHAIQRLLALLRIPSISTDRVHAPDCEVAADWLVQDLRDMGFRADRHATPGRPMVVG